MFVLFAAMGLGDLDGDIALVTAVGSSVGEAVARLFAARGAKVVVTDRNQLRAELLAEEIGGRAVPMVCDMAEREQAAAAVQAAARVFGGLDVLVTGVDGEVGPTADEASLRHTADANVLAVYNGIMHAAGPIAARGGGAIVNLVAPLPPETSAYRGARTGVEMLTRSAALELLPVNVRVNAIVPGGARPLRLASNGGSATESDPDLPDEVARLAVALVGKVTSGLCYPVAVGRASMRGGGTEFGAGRRRGRI